MTTEHGWEKLNESQRDGRACVRCGGEDGAMSPIGILDGRQLFAHPMTTIRGGAHCCVRSSSEIKHGDRAITLAFKVRCPTCLAPPFRECAPVGTAADGLPHEARILAGAAWVPPEGAATVYLDEERGNDATGERDNRERPFRTFAAALAVMRDGDALFPAARADVESRAQDASAVDDNDDDARKLVELWRKRAANAASLASAMTPGELTGSDVARLASYLATASTWTQAADELETRDCAKGGA